MQAACAFGGSRTLTLMGVQVSADDLAADHGHFATAEWLTLSHDWNTPLHYLEVISASHARQLLRDGADAHCSYHADGDTPLSLARALRELGLAGADTAADVVLRHAEPNSPSTRSHSTPARRPGSAGSSLSPLSPGRS